MNRSNKRGSKYRCSLNQRGARGELDEIIKSFSHLSCQIQCRLNSRGMSELGNFHGYGDGRWLN